MEQGNQTRSCVQGGYLYVVQRGDTLPSIAFDNALSVEEILAANPTLSASSTLNIGDYICIPPYGPVGDGTAADDLFSVTPETTVTPVTPVTPGVTITPSAPSINITVRPGPTTTTYTCPIGHQARVIGVGQTYADLLVENNISYQAMQQSNPNLNPSRLVAGTPYCAPPAGARQSCGRYRTYRMQDGENLAMAAQRLGTTAGRLMMLNPTMLPTDFTSGALICVP